MLKLSTSSLGTLEALLAEELSSTLLSAEDELF